jgi:hypothetical protein
MTTTDNPGNPSTTFQPSSTLDEAIRRTREDMRFEFPGSTISDARIILSALEAAEAKVKEYQSLFDLQHTRTLKADKLWQDAHTEECHVYPDLGKLIDWMLDEISGWRHRAKLAEDSFENAKKFGENATKRIAELLDHAQRAKARCKELIEAGEKMRLAQQKGNMTAILIAQDSWCDLVDTITK